MTNRGARIANRELDRVARDSRVAQEAWDRGYAAALTAENLGKAVSVLAELAALVRGECPSLLNEDSGGDANLAMAIDAVLQPKAGGPELKFCVPQAVLDRINGK